MSAELTTRTCIQCKQDFSFSGWRLDALCPRCRNQERLRQVAVITCPRCLGPKAPSLTRNICDACFRAEEDAAIARFGTN